MCASSNGNTTGVTCGAGTANLYGASDFTPIFSGIRVAQPLVFCIMSCRLLFGLLSFFFWSLC